MIFLGLILLRWKDETRKECRYPIQYTPLSLSYTLTLLGHLGKRFTHLSLSVNKAISEWLNLSGF